jgi:hypothetical protein
MNFKDVNDVIVSIVESVSLRLIQWSVGYYLFFGSLLLCFISLSQFESAIVCRLLV